MMMLQNLINDLKSLGISQKKQFYIFSFDVNGQ